LNISSDGDNVWYNWNGSNVTYGGEEYIDFGEGPKTLYAWANDSAGNSNSANVAFEVILDACDYSGSGNWEINCSENCLISSEIDLLGNNISIIGTGVFTTTVNISNWEDLFIQGTDSSNRCEVYCLDGGCFT
jgi:hypothetical protein